jgi:flagellar M-ring protein FliF
MAAIDNIIENFKAWPAINKIGLLAVLVLSLAGLILLMTWINKADYQVLYSSLSEDDAASIAQELQSRNIPYQLRPSGTILIQSDKVYDLRLELASEGLPQGGGVGFEIFDNTSFTTSEFVQKLNFKRALEGELSRTISSLSTVQKSRVHLVMPEKSLFAVSNGGQEASAAVFVTLSQGRKLKDKEVEGVVHLVSSSVEDLSPENITVVDNKGNLLTNPAKDGMLARSGTQMDYQQNFEKNLSTKIISILEPVVGQGKIKARVSAAFDFTMSERTEEIFDPDGVVVRSEQKSTEKTVSGSGAGGIPGVGSNLPGGASAGSFGSQGQSEKADEMINYETSKTVTRIVESPVSLERLSVAIIIDGINASQKDSVENADRYAVRSEADIKYYEDIVKKSIGFTDDRGDEITVTVMPFQEIVTEEAGEVERDIMPIVYSVLRYLVPLMVALIFFFIVLRPLIKSLTKPVSVTRSRGVVGVEGGGSVEQLEQPMQPREISMEKQITRWANENPEDATGLVKSWLGER